MENLYTIIFGAFTLVLYLYIYLAGHKKSNGITLTVAYFLFALIVVLVYMRVEMWFG